jgi:hypothetical protein
LGRARRRRGRLGAAAGPGGGGEAEGGPGREATWWEGLSGGGTQARRNTWQCEDAAPVLLSAPAGRWGRGRAHRWQARRALAGVVAGVQQGHSEPLPRVRRCMVHRELGHQLLGRFRASRPGRGGHVDRDRRGAAPRGSLRRERGPAVQAGLRRERHQVPRGGGGGGLLCGAEPQKGGARGERDRPRLEGRRRGAGRALRRSGVRGAPGAGGVRRAGRPRFRASVVARGCLRAPIGRGRSPAPAGGGPDHVASG